MNCVQWFDPQIHKVIDMFSHPVWFIILDDEKICPCVDHVSKSPNPKCPICLGLGKKITLTRVYASNQNVRNQLRGENIGAAEKEVYNVYYTKNPTDIKIGDYIYDKQCIDIVTDIFYERSDASELVYWRIETTPKKTYVKEFRKLLETTLKGAGYKDGY